jgi:hypothetical protein
MQTTNKGQITRVNSSNLANPPLKKTLKTTMMLKLLSRLFPTKQWTSQWLIENVKKSPRGCFSCFEGHLTLTYKGQPDGFKTEHEYEITVHQTLAKKLAEAYRAIQDSLIDHRHIDTDALLPPNSKYNEYLTEEGTYEWNNIILRSPAEIDIAITLEEKGVLFFTNSRCRVRNRAGFTETKETDFLVFHKGKVRILEVDGKQYHQQPHLDYARDRLFDKYGIRTTRYMASECMNNPSEVVEEFLELFDF